MWYVLIRDLHVFQGKRVTVQGELLLFKQAMCGSATLRLAKLKSPVK
jgi:hypothetical protein